jgi:uncharacterized protein (DUF1800 family)
MTDIASAASLGSAGWVEQQFTAAPLQSHWSYIQANESQYQALAQSFWLQAVTGPDQLRQRMVFALSEIMVVSNANALLPPIEADYAGAAYLDMLGANCFGNFRQLIEGVTRNVFMGIFLSHMRNIKEDTTSGRIPDENYAREVMQLFTIGLWQLNTDGSRKKDGAGTDIPTYTQADVSGMAKVFTGMSWGQTVAKEEQNFYYGPEHYNVPMEFFSQYHSASEKRIVNGVVIPAGTAGEATLKIALDTLFNHPNVGPFIGEQLIKRLVTSNPSRAYVGRVAAAFNNNGAGVRGDMKAVIRAILLDADARDSSKVTAEDWGKLREPMVRFATWMRAFGARAGTGKFGIVFIEDPVNGIGQAPLGAPSVFNFFRPSYAPPGLVAQRSLVAPEFQITHDTTVTGYARFMMNVIEYGYGLNGADVIRGNYATELSMATTPDTLLDRLNLLLVAGRMTDTTKATIKGAIEAIPASGDGPTRRVYTAIALTMVAPEFLVQK